FPLAVVAAAPGLPSATRYQPLAPLRRGPGGELRTLPVLTPHGQAARGVASRAVLTPEVMDAELTSLATTVYGVGGHAVLDLVRSEESVITFHQAGEVYPFRNEAVDALIAATGGAALAHPDDANDLAALLTIAAANPHRLRGYTNAAPVAYAILEQVRTLGGCRT